MKLDALKLGIAGGIVWGVCMFLCTFLSIYFDYSTGFLELMSSLYPGYTITVFGAFVGLLYGFIDAFVALFILAWLYNKML